MTRHVTQRLLAGVLTMLAMSFTAPLMAQPTTEDPDWKESDVPPPPAFDVSKLVLFEVSSQSTLVYGVDPATVDISKKDGIVRYVMVASSPSGARNVMYEGLRCGTGEYKTYARHSTEGGWKMTGQTDWRTLFGNSGALHALRFAQAGGCDNHSIPLSVRELVTSLKSATLRAGQ